VWSASYQRTKEWKEKKKMLFSKRCRCNKNCCNKLLICTVYITRIYSTLLQYSAGGVNFVHVFSASLTHTHTHTLTPTHTSHTYVCNRAQWVAGYTLHRGDPTKKGSREGHRASVCVCAALEQTYERATILYIYKYNIYCNIVTRSKTTRTHVS